MRLPLAVGTTRTRLALNLLGLSVLSSVTLLVVGGISAHLALRDQLRQRLMAVASSGALTVDATALADVTGPKDEASPAYLQVQRGLRVLRRANPGIRSVYTIRPNRDPKRWTYLVDAEEDPKLVSHAGERYDVMGLPEMQRARNGPAADTELTRGRWGSWLSGYAPIKDRAGRTVAVLGVDMSAASVLSEERTVLRAITIAALLLLLVSAFLAEGLAAMLASPLVALAGATRRVDEGDLETSVAADGTSEIRVLAGSFNTMVQALREHRDRLVQLSNTDFLTSLHNHRYFQERLDQEIGRALRYHHPLSLILLDLDHFRQVNAAHGHQGGDDLLLQVATILKRSLRECDIPTRYGGEEFAVILPETAAVDACEVAERIRAVIEGTAFEVRSLGTRRAARLTVSGGIAEYPGDTREKDGLLLAADVALLRAKHMLRNRICRFAEDDAWPTGGMDPADLHWALQDASIAAVESLAQALDARDHYTRGHSENVTRLSLAIASVLGIPKDELARVKVAGLLHDIGKIGIPDRVLLKRGPLSPEEWELVRSHPLVGADILAKAPMLLEVIPIVLSHHERYDGTGYPGAVAGEEIPLAARILAVADAYDAMTSQRPYREALSEEQALAELLAHAGSQFDPEIARACREALQQLGQTTSAGAGEMVALR
jgi:diguanylate cyclase (GGDEF)-like protein/putative nucleotidyltransferase with HDIG domain